MSGERSAIQTERTDETQEEDIDFEEEAEQLTAVEQRIRSDYEDAQQESDDEADVDLRYEMPTLIDSPFVKAPMIGGEIDDSGETFTARVLVDGETREFDIPYPDDPTDETEALVRLCRWNGVSVENVASMETIPLVEFDSGYRVYVPAVFADKEIDVAAPLGKEFSIPRPTPIISASQIATKILRKMMATPAISVEEDDDGQPDVRVSSGAGKLLMGLLGITAVTSALNIFLSISALTLIGEAAGIGFITLLSFMMFMHLNSGELL